MAAHAAVRTLLATDEVTVGEFVCRPGTAGGCARTTSARYRSSPGRPGSACVRSRAPRRTRTSASPRSASETPTGTGPPPSWSPRQPRHGVRRRRQPTRL